MDKLKAELKEKINYIDTDKFTKLLVDYNCKNNPIKMYNESYDYYVTTYQTAPINNEVWHNIIELRKEFEFKKIDKSINRKSSNIKIETDIESLEEEKIKRREEICYFIDEVKNFDLSKGKIKQIDMPVDLWKDIDLIANHFSTNYKFFLYSNREDLVMSAIEKCIRYMGNFSGQSSGNAFSYFSTVVRNSFFMDIKKEYGYANTKQKIHDKFYNSTKTEQCDQIEGN
jgi:hypothetical protein